ncbi:MAG: hypothetical protein ACLTJB_00425 [Holdemania filiformis]
MAYDLAVMFSVIAHVADPWMFVIGGGMMQSKDVFLDKVVANFKNLVHVPMRDTLFEVAKLEKQESSARRCCRSPTETNIIERRNNLGFRKMPAAICRTGSSAGRQCSERTAAGN